MASYLHYRSASGDPPASATSHAVGRRAPRPAQAVVLCGHRGCVERTTPPATSSVTANTLTGAAGLTVKARPAAGSRAGPTTPSGRSPPPTADTCGPRPAGAGPVLSTKAEPSGRITTTAAGAGPARRRPPGGARARGVRLHLLGARDRAARPGPPGRARLSGSPWPTAPTRWSRRPTWTAQQDRDHRHRRGDGPTADHASAAGAARQWCGDRRGDDARRRGAGRRAPGPGRRSSPRCGPSSSAGASTPTLAMSPVTSQCSATSAEHRGHSARCARIASASSGSTASRAKAPSELGDLVVAHGSVHAALHAVLGQCRPEPAQPTADPALHRSLGLAQDRRHLAVGVTVEVGHLDGGALLGGQARHRRLHLLGDGEVPRLVLDVVARDHRLTHRALLALAAGRLRADDVDGAAVGLGHEERPQRPPTRVEALGRVPQVDEDLLGHLLGQIGRPQDATGQGEHRSPVTPVRLGQRRLVHPGDRHHQGGVAGRLELQHVEEVLRSRPPTRMTGAPRPRG